MTLVAPAAGRRARAAGNEITFKIGPDSGAEDLSLFESVVPPGGKVFPHRHRDFEEAFAVARSGQSGKVILDWTES